LETHARARHAEKTAAANLFTRPSKQARSQASTHPVT
jgi:hypothetical protein